jgi:hypothetical protein
MARYSINLNDGLLEEHDDHYVIKCKNFIDPIGSPAGGNRRPLVKVGITKRLTKAAMAERNTYSLGRIFGILPVEMPRITSAHRGVKRPMRFEQDGEADGKVFVVVMHPTSDVYVEISEGNLEVQSSQPPSRQVFVALLSRNRRDDEYPNIDFWLEHCNWVDSDPDNPQFPVDYMNRYEKACIWAG